MIGQRFNKLTVIEEGPRRCRGKRTWICRCDCGNITKPIEGNNLKIGHTKSCGCYRVSLAGAARSTKHGMKGSRLYSVWSNMKGRCFCSTNKDYRHYGGRGITVCDEWKDNFQAFYDWSIANGYDKDAKFGDCTIDRIDVNGNYEPSNCRWVSMKVQNNNQRPRLRKGAVQ